MLGEREPDRDPAFGAADHLLDQSLAELVEDAPCGFAFSRPDGLILRTNRTLLAWTGHDRADLVGVRRFQDLLTIPGRIFYENQVYPLLRLRGAVHGIAVDLLRPGRDPLPVLVGAVQRADPDGRPTLLASTIVDATDRRAYERELLRSRRDAEHLASVVAASSDAILSATVAGEVLTWNAAAERLYGWSAAEMIGRPLAMLVPPERGDELAALSARLVRGEPVERVATVHRATRPERWPPSRWWRGTSPTKSGPTPNCRPPGTPPRKPAASRAPSCAR